MVFYFSGTGNSQWVAQTVADAFSDHTAEIGAAVINKIHTFELDEKEKVGFVFPVHSWGIPPIVKNFIQKLNLENYTSQLIYAIFTCGDECGYTQQQILKLLQTKGWKSYHTYSIQMPNNYIVFPGFDIDDKELENNKKENAKKALTEILTAISADTKTEHYIKGKMPFLKSRIIYPLFCKFALNSKPFYSTGNCTGCGICAKKCPTANIRLENKRPIWKNNCTQCLACIHYCPERAIEYGKVTQKKGRYTYKK